MRYLTSFPRIMWPIILFTFLTIVWISGGIIMGEEKDKSEHLLLLTTKDEVFKTSAVGDESIPLSISLVISKAGGTSQFSLLLTGSDMREAGFSPDGKRLAFASGTKYGVIDLEVYLFVQNIEKNNIEQQLTFEGVAAAPAWAPRTVKLLSFTGASLSSSFKRNGSPCAK